MEKRKIIHIDMDAFFAAVEQRDHPEYQCKPVIVGGSPEDRGVVAACSYEARKFGIHSAMASAKAKKLCPDAIFLRPRFNVYRQVSTEIQAIFRSFTDQVEPLSLDEAYLDVTECTLHKGSATLIAKALKQKIKRQTGLTASAGVSYNKFLAKIASDIDKPDGLFLIKPEQGEEFIAQLPIRKFFGVGKATEIKMNALGIFTGADLKQWSKENLVTKFGKTGHYYFNVVRGIDNRPVKNSRVRKSLGTETTFAQDLNDVNLMLSQLNTLALKVAENLHNKKLAARTITLKVKYDNFEQITRSKTLNEPVSEYEKIIKLLPGLLMKTEVGQRKVRLLGITTSNFDVQIPIKQITLFTNHT